MLLYKEAINLVKMGYRIFPLIPNEKKPLKNSAGLHDATNEENKIENWWSNNEEFNIGISTDGLIVVDIDGLENEWPGGNDRFYDLQKAPHCYTPNGGLHFYFKDTIGEFKNSVSKLASKVDIRATGGYVVAPPSIFKGVRYSWVPGFELVDYVNLPEIPEWLYNQLKALNNTPREKLQETSSEIKTGYRNDTLARIAGGMRRMGLTEYEINSSLQIINLSRCNPPLSEKEINKIAESISKYEPDQVTVSLIEDHFNQDFTFGIEDKNKNDKPEKELSESMFRIPGFINELLDYQLEAAPYPNVVMSFCGAISLLSTLIARKVREVGDVRSNLYILGLAYSGSGKDFPRKINSKIMYEIGMQQNIGTMFASGEGLQDALFANGVMLYQTDEIDTLLQSINKSKEARHEVILQTLLTLYSSSNTIFYTRTRARTREDALRLNNFIDQPSLTIFGTAIPNHYYNALSERLLTNGFFSRTMIIESLGRSKGQDPKIIDIPKRILEQAFYWKNYEPNRDGNLRDNYPQPTIIHYDKQAMNHLREVCIELDNNYLRSENKNDSIGTVVWSRVGENIRKLALIYACSENFQNPIISIKAIEWASNFVIYQAKMMLYNAETRIADSPFEQLCLKALLIINEESSKQIYHSLLLRRLKINARLMIDLMTTLEQRGQVVKELIDTGNRKKSTVYRLV